VTNNSKNTDGRIGRYDVAVNVIIKAETLILKKKFDGRALQFPTLARAIFATSSNATFPRGELHFRSILRLPHALSQEFDRVLDACGFSASTNGEDRRYGKSSANSMICSRARLTPARLLFHFQRTCSCAIVKSLRFRWH